MFPLGSDDEARNVAAGNAVLAGIAASDAICCIRLGNDPVLGQAHHAAADLLRTVQPGGRTLATALATVLAVKDPSHYGESFVSQNRLRTTLRAATRLVEAAEEFITGP